MYPYDFAPSGPKKKEGNYLVPSDWNDALKRPRGVEVKNGIYFLNDATPSKNVTYCASEDALHLKELSFFLIWRYQKTYTREYFEQLYGKIFQAFADYLEGKRANLAGIPGLFSGIVFGDKQYKFKQSFHVDATIPAQMRGAKVVMGFAVDRVQGPSGNIIRNPQDMANAYKELKTILSQELDYMAQNPAFQKVEQNPKS